MKAGRDRRVIGVFIATSAQPEMPFDLSQGMTTDMSDLVGPAISYL